MAIALTPADFGALKRVQAGVRITKKAHDRLLALELVRKDLSGLVDRRCCDMGALTSGGIMRLVTGR
jgi:hypothetical protein